VRRDFALSEVERMIRDGEIKDATIRPTAVAHRYRGKW
jgi:hypothetical protein